MDPVLRFVFIAIASCVYAALPFLVGLDFGRSFLHPALIALIVVLFALSGVSFFAGGNLGPGVREARGNRWSFSFS